MSCSHVAPGGGVAGILSVSPKTIEAQLANAYRKLGIHTRAELGARVSEPGRTPDVHAGAGAVASIRQEDDV